MEAEAQQAMIDADGYRPNVGIVLTDGRRHVLWARRIGQEAWQFPQGGIRADETPEEAMFRELREEVGLGPRHVQVMGSTRGWLRYRLPKRFIRRNCDPVCIGQKQVWFVLRFLGDEQDVRLDLGEKPEFDHWRWVPYWEPVNQVVFFKRGVYRRALHELAPLVSPELTANGPRGDDDGRRRRRRRARDTGPRGREVQMGRMDPRRVPGY